MKRNTGRVFLLSAACVAVLVCLAAALAAPAAARAADNYSFLPAGGSDIPLGSVPGSEYQTPDPPDDGSFTYGAVVRARGTRANRGSGNLAITIPGQPERVHVYIGGLDKPTAPGPHFPTGDPDVRVIVVNALGATTVTDFAPVAHSAGNVHLNRLDITARVTQGRNVVRVRRHNLNRPDGFAVVAVYRDATPGARRGIVQIHDGIDLGWHVHTPDFGPDTELVTFPFDSWDQPRQARVYMGIGSAQPRRGDEVFLFTESTLGHGSLEAALDALLPDTDGDAGAPGMGNDIVQRQWPLTRQDRSPLGNDPADGADHPEAVDGAVSLEEDKLGVGPRYGGYRRGAEFDLFDSAYDIPASHDFAAFQVQSEDPENGDSIVLYFAVNVLPIPPPNINPIPEIEVVKDADPVLLPEPGGPVTFTVTINNLGGEAVTIDTLDDSVFGDVADPANPLITGTTCALPISLPLFGSTQCAFSANVTGAAGRPHENTVRADGTGDESGIPVWDDDPAVVNFYHPGLQIVKSVEPRLGYPGAKVTYGFLVTNTGTVDLSNVVVDDDVLGLIGTIASLPAGQSTTLYHSDYPLPACGSFDTGYRAEPCEGSGYTAAEGCAQINTATASESDYGLYDDDKACVTILKLGRIVVEKQTLPDGATQSFAFTASYDADGFSLGDGQSNDSGDLLPGTYAVSETGPEGWELLSAVCDDGSAPGAISLQPGETVTCVFTNVALNPDFTVAKSASVDEGYPGDKVTYEFTVTNTGEVPLVDVVVTDDVLGPIGTVTLGVGASTKLYHTDYPLPQCEGSAFTRVTRCDGETVLEERCSLPNTVTAAWGGLTRTAKDCVEIKKKGRIVVVKQTDPDGAADSFDFEASYDADGFSLSDGQSNDSGLLLPGAYSVSENVPAGWTLESAVCQSSIGDAEVPASIELDPNETVTCTFTNRRLVPDFTVAKSASVDEGYPGDKVTYEFTVTNTGEVPLVDVVVTDDVLGPIGTVTLGVGASTKLYHTDYPLPQCEGSAFTRVTRCDGETVLEERCSLPNTVTAAWGGLTRTAKDCVEIKKKGRIVVVKQTDPDGAADSFDFEASYDADGFSLSDGQSNDSGLLLPGAYSVSENVPAGWTLESAVCQSSIGDAEVPASIELDPNETVTCTFTNKRCGECLGKVSMLRLRFLGSSNSLILITVRADKFPNDVVFEGYVDPSAEFEVYGAPSSAGGFDGTLGTEVKVYVNGVLNTAIHTSCSQPIGPGTVWGSFLVTYSESSEGGPICSY